MALKRPDFREAVYKHGENRHDPSGNDQGRGLFHRPLSGERTLYSVLQGKVGRLCEARRGILPWTPVPMPLYQDRRGRKPMNLPKNKQAPRPIHEWQPLEQNCCKWLSEKGWLRGEDLNL